MGCCSSSKTTDTNQSSTVTQTLPQWVLDAGKSNVDTANLLTQGVLPGPNGEPASASGSLTAGFTPDQLDMFSMVRGLPSTSGLTPDQLGVTTANAIAGRTNPTAGTFFTPTAQVASVTPMTAAQVGSVGDISAKAGADFMGAYKDPWLNDVVNTSLKDYQASADNNANALRARYGAAGAFGDDRQGVAEGQFAADTARGMGSLAANLRSTGFNTAAGYGQSDAARALAASQSNQSTQLARAIQQAANDQAASAANFDFLGKQSFQNAANSQDAGKFNAGQAQNNSQFNVNSGQASDALKLQAAGQAGDTLLNLDKYNTGLDLNKIDLLGQTGDQQQAQDQAGKDEALKALQFRAAQLGLAPYPTTTTGNVNGTTTQTSQGSIWDILGGLSGAAGAVGLKFK